MRHKGSEIEAEGRERGWSLVRGLTALCQLARGMGERCECELPQRGSVRRSPDYPKVILRGLPPLITVNCGFKK